MKNKVFAVLFMFLALTARGHAQNEILSTLALQDPVLNTIVRNCGDTCFVSYVETTDNPS